MIRSLRVPLVLILAVLWLCGTWQRVSTGADAIWDLPPGVPAPPVPDLAAMTPPRIELGRRLFYDTRLSRNGERACGACHRPEFAFTDTRPRAIGATGQLHERGSMSLVNVAYRRTLTWQDPSVTSLEQQALLPMFGEKPVELGLKGHEVRVYADLAADPLYLRLFGDAFPAQGREITTEKVTAALAAFERSIVSFRSAYDDYRFNAHADALSAAQKEGLTLFVSPRAGCAQCHRGLNFDGDDYPNHVPAPAHGRSAADLARFRAPTLRNVARTSPYFHDGRALTLEEVLAPFALTPAERDNLVAFLDALTDVDALVDSRWSDPWLTKW
jgi:cytochrome c peroxidase